MTSRTVTRPPYTYKTEPRGKQLDVIETSWHQRQWALLCRPGTGKTKMGLDTAGMLYAAKEITGLIVVTVNDVHRQWFEEGAPQHLGVPYVGGVYDSGMRVLATRALEKALTTRAEALRILTISYSGLQTPAGKKFAHALAVAHRCLLIVDESHMAGNTKSAAYKAVKKLAPMCPYRRLSTGTLLRQNPFGAYGQFELLGSGILGYSTLTAFKSMYSQVLDQNHWLAQRVNKQFEEKTGRKGIKLQIVARDEENRPIYRNLAHLRQRIQQFASFLTLADTQGTEPEVRPNTRYVHLTARQKALYDDIREYGVGQHRSGQLTADTALSVATRLCQIAGGFVPSDDDPNATPVDDPETPTPKVVETLSAIQEIGPDEKVVIWCRFTAEIVATIAALEAVYGVGCAVRYDGKVDQKVRNANKVRFMTDTVCRYFVGHVAAGGTGLDGLQTCSSYMIFYSNGYSYTNREQAIARQARTGGSLIVNVIDIMMMDSVDFDVVRCMQTAQDVHESVLKRHILAAVA